SRWIPLLRFMQDALKRLIIARLLEERQARHRPIEYVVDQPTGRDASVSWHATKLTAADLRVNETSCAPFSSPSAVISPRTIFLLIDASGRYYAARQIL